MFYLNQIFYKLTINLTKLSILALYLRIFTQTWFRATCFTLSTIITSYAFSSIIATIFQCTPVRRIWDKSIAGACIDITTFWYSNAIYNLLTDFAILATVPPVIWTLSLPTRQKLGLTAVFGLGVFVFATSILRMTTLDHGSKASDPVYGTLISTIWTTVEASTAIVVACLPMVRTPIQKVWPMLFPSRSGGESQSTVVAEEMKLSPRHESGKGSGKKSLESMIEEEMGFSPARGCGGSTELEGFEHMFEQHLGRRDGDGIS